MSFVTPKRFAAAFAVTVAVGAVLGIQQGQVSADGEGLPNLGELGKLIAHYPGARLYRLGDDVRVSGIGRQLAWALTDDRPDKVSDYYGGVWTSQGLTVNEGQSGDDHWVSGQTMGEGWVRMVIASPRPEGTVIIASVRDASEAPKANELPHPPSCEVRSRHGASQGQSNTDVGLFRCEAHAEDVVGYYRKTLADDASTHSHQGPTRSLTFSGQNGRRYVMVSVTQLRDSPPLSELTVSWQER